MIHLVPSPHPSPVEPASPSTWTRATRTLQWLSLLATAHAALAAAGRVLPSPPTPWAGGDLAGWLTTTDPGVSAFALLRLLALAVAWYLTLVTALALLSRLSGIPRLISLADRVALPVVRRALHHAIGVGLAVTIVGSSGPLLTGLAPAAAQPVTEPVVTMQVIEDERGVPPEVRPSDDGVPTTGPEVQMVLLEEGPAPTRPAAAPDDTAPAPRTPGPVVADPPPSAPPATDAASVPGPTSPNDGSPTSPPPAPPAEADPAASPPAATTPTDPPVASGTDPLAGAPAPADAAATSEPTTTEWTIRPGDHLWHVAEQTLHDAWQRPPTDAETAGYWRGLIADNRERLVDAGNPDLVFPGQQFRLPPVPAG